MKNGLLIAKQACTCLQHMYIRMQHVHKFYKILVQMFWKSCASGKQSAVEEVGAVINIRMDIRDWLP